VKIDTPNQKLFQPLLMFSLLLCHSTVRAFVLPCFVWHLWESWPHRCRCRNNLSLLAPRGRITMTRGFVRNQISPLVLRDKSTGVIPHSFPLSWRC